MAHSRTHLAIFQAPEKAVGILIHEPKSYQNSLLNSKRLQPDPELNIKGAVRLKNEMSSSWASKEGAQTLQPAPEAKTKHILYTKQKQ